jgi:hypothetical protein
MQRTLFTLSIGTVLAITLRPSLAETAQENIAKLRWLEHANPAADFERQVVQQHDTRFMSVYGLSFSTEFPGLPDTPAAHRLVEKYGKHHVEGTTDVISGVEYHRLLDKAFDYAKRYNMLLLRYLNSHKNT